MKRSILLGASIVSCLLILLTGCQPFVTLDTDVMTVFLYDAYTGAPIPVTDIDTVEVTSRGITSTITTEESAAGWITTTTAADATTVIGSSLKFYDFETSEIMKIVIVTTSYIRFETYVTPTATSRFPVYVAYLLPTAYVLKSPAYTIEVNDGATALTVGGEYLITPASGTDLGLGITVDGVAAPTVLTAYIPPNWGGNNDGGIGDGALTPLSGTIPADGLIVIAEDTLYPGVTYSVYVYDVPGYQDPAAPTTFVPGTTSNAANITISLTAM